MCIVSIATTAASGPDGTSVHPLEARTAFTADLIRSTMSGSRVLTLSHEYVLYWPKLALRSQSVFTCSAKHAPAKANAKAAVVIAHNFNRILFLPCCLVGIDPSRQMHLRFQIARSMSPAKGPGMMPAAGFQPCPPGYSAWVGTLRFGQLADRIGRRLAFMASFYLGCVRPSHTARKAHTALPGLARGGIPAVIPSLFRERA